MLPISSSTTPQELERMLFVVNPECHAVVSDNLDQVEEYEAEIASLEKRLEGTDKELHDLRQSLRDLLAA